VMALFAGVVALQLTKNLQLRRRNRFHAAWRPLLVQSLSDIPQSAPAVRSRDTLNFLFYWNYFHEYPKLFVLLELFSRVAARRR
jgi:hypothetical protein